MGGTTDTSLAFRSFLAASYDGMVGFAHHWTEKWGGMRGGTTAVGGPTPLSNEVNLTPQVGAYV